jgi:MSHA biogenesis protein MshJ
VKEYLIKLRFKLRRKSERDRIILLLGIAATIFIIWLLVVFLPQYNNLKNAQVETEGAIIKTTELTEKKASLERIVSDDTIVKLLAKFEELKIKSTRLTQEIAKYNQRFISDKQLAALLYSMLKQTTGVSIESFSNIEYLGGEKAEIVSKNNVSIAQAAVSSTPTAPNQFEVEGSKALKTPPPIDRNQYKLVLSGNYFSIMNYLQLLEKLEWQLYWDEMEYWVAEYPNATVTIKFYTLKPEPPVLVPSLANPLTREKK